MEPCGGDGQRDTGSGVRAGGKGARNQACVGRAGRFDLGAAQRAQEGLGRARHICGGSFSTVLSAERRALDEERRDGAGCSARGMFLYMSVRRVLRSAGRDEGEAYFGCDDDTGCGVFAQGAREIVRGVRRAYVA